VWWRGARIMGKRARSLAVTTRLDTLRALASALRCVVSWSAQTKKMGSLTRYPTPSSSFYSNA
jgi:hypothetical protein